MITRILLIVSLLMPAMAAGAGEVDPLFADNATLPVTITAPLMTLLREKPKEEYLQGTFTYTDDSGAAVNLEIGIRARGHYRHENCDFPPINLNFKKGQVKDTLFAHQDKMKLVVHCENGDRYEQIVLREYLAYRLLNHMTGQSFQVRLLRIDWRDSEGRRDVQRRYAFLIEHKKRLAHRLDRKNLEIDRTVPSALQSDHLNLTSVFQYLIGNTDFSPIAPSYGNECCHNYVLFSNNGDPIVAIPYDFDHAGWVSAPYAKPPDHLKIRNVRQRVYRGRCVNNGYLDQSISRFQAERDSLYALVESQEGLDKATRKNLLKYMDGFYKVIDDPRDVERRLVERCL